MNILIFLLPEIIAASVPDWLIPAVNPGCVVLTNFDFELSVTSSVGDSSGHDQAGGQPGRPGDDQDSNQPDYTKKCERMRLKNEIETKSDFQITEMRFEKEKQKLVGKILKAQHSTESFGAVSASARANITGVFTEVGYSDHWISFGMSKCLNCSDFPCSHVCNRYTADYDVCECPPCWELGRDMTTCVPKTENYSLTCSSGMKVTLDSCVLGAASRNGDAVIMSQNGDCRADYNSSAERFEMEIGMGSCGSALNIDNENNMIILQNQLKIPEVKMNGIKIQSGFKIPLICEYDAKVEIIGEVEKKLVIVLSSGAQFDHELIIRKKIEEKLIAGREVRLVDRHGILTV